MLSKIDAFKAVAKKYGFKVMQYGDSYRLCAQNTDHKWVSWVGFYPKEDRVSYFGETDYLNIWLCDTRKDFTPEKCLLFVGELNKALELTGDDRFLVRNLIDPEDWQEIAQVCDAHEDKRYLSSGLSKDAQALFEIFKKHYVEKGYMYSGMIPFNAARVISFDYSVYRELIDAGLLWQRDCNGYAFELTVPVRKKLIDEYNLSEVWEADPHGRAFYPNRHDGEITRVNEKFTAWENEKRSLTEAIQAAESKVAKQNALSDGRPRQQSDMVNSR